MSAYFITSCGTSVGKTFITTALCWHLMQSSRIIHAVKPVISGWNKSDFLNNDTCKILRSLNLDCNDNNVTKISPWRLYYPHAPNIAARLENVKLNYNEILTFCYRCVQRLYDYLFIEGIGGVMSPITDCKTCLDLIKDLNIKVILVVGSYIGSISHTLTALKVLGDLDVKIILSVKSEEDTNISDIVEFICDYTGKSVYIQPYINDSFDLWKYTSRDLVDFVVK